MTTPIKPAPARAAAKNRALDRIMAAPGADAQRSEAVDAMRDLGNFQIHVDSWDLPGNVARLVAHLRDHPRSVRREQVRPC